MRAHDPDDLITKIAGTHFEPGAEAPVWEGSLNKILPDAGARGFLQEVAGIGLTGDTSEQILGIPYGTGANGKSTALRMLLEAAGDYGMQTAPDLLMHSKNQKHPTEVADLFRVRLACSIEVEQGQRLAESHIKQLTGGDRIRARRMREDFWEFEFLPYNPDGCKP